MAKVNDHISCMTYMQISHLDYLLIYLFIEIFTKSLALPQKLY